MLKLVLFVAQRGVLVAPPPGGRRGGLGAGDPPRGGSGGHLEENTRPDRTSKPKGSGDTEGGRRNSLGRGSLRSEQNEA